MICAVAAWVDRVTVDPSATPIELDEYAAHLRDLADLVERTANRRRGLPDDVDRAR